MKKFRTFFAGVIENPEGLEELYRNILPFIKDRALLLLSGPVGAGKTTSVQTLARLLGMKDVASPSFAIHHRYENTRGQILDHVDLYRLQDEEDLESTGFWDLFSQSQSLVVVEWADRLCEDVLPLNWQEIRVHLQPADGSSSRRNIKIEIQE